MKKIFLALLFLLGGANFTGTFADNTEDVPLYIIDEDDSDGGKMKAPRRPLVATLENGVLTLPATPVDYQLQLLNADGELVYTAFIPTGTTQIVLPSLTGDFEIRLVTATYYYIGFITL